MAEEFKCGICGKMVAVHREKFHMLIHKRQEGASKKMEIKMADILELRRQGYSASSIAGKVGLNKKYVEMALRKSTTESYSLKDGKQDEKTGAETQPSPDKLPQITVSRHGDTPFMEIWEVPYAYFEKDMPVGIEDALKEINFRLGKIEEMVYAVFTELDLAQFEKENEENRPKTADKKMEIQDSFAELEGRLGSGNSFKTQADQKNWPTNFSPKSRSNYRVAGIALIVLLGLLILSRGVFW